MSDQPRPPSMPPPQPQPFRFWLPYRSNVGSWRHQPPPPLPPLPRPQAPGSPTPTPAEPAPARAVEEDTPLQADSSDESDTIAVEALDSLRLRGARPAMADLELTLSRSPPPPTGPEQGTSGGGDRGNDGAKISISGFPRARLFDGARAPYRREIEDGLKSLAGRETPAPSPPDVGNQGYRVFTLAGHNVGASMVLGNGSSGAPLPRSNEPEGSARPPSVAANVNSNVQGVNNSAMEESTCNSGDPGVRVDIKNAHEDRVALGQGKEGEKKPEEPARTPPPQAESSGEAARAPPKTRRCLRALMIEERKPKPISCRFQCVADHAPPPATASNSGGNKSAEEGAEEGTR
ncbi:hypothetical protein CFC21_071352 [Triticum aestivum]|uniref:Uncharacterized protein n=3 Tax=Triticum TaxID=4564 RepID=A0A9R1AKV1_TRITD|nr:hypothetical protein CFC21_071352 [Triticum aestivum]VAI31631.1 unnamed protein product [Triticum turgidum subsp. durum]